MNSKVLIKVHYVGVPVFIHVARKITYGETIKARLLDSDSKHISHITFCLNQYDKVLKPLILSILD
jgi:hypothetical protein